MFGAGFALGPLRILWLVPRIGARMAELAEAPIMLVVTVFAARWIVRRFAIASAPLPRLGVGLVALGLLLGAEFGFVLWLRGVGIAEYLATRDSVSGAVYYALLGLVALMPVVVARKRRASPAAPGAKVR